MTPQELFGLLSAHWRRLLAAAIGCGLLGAIVAFTLPRYYRTEVVLAPAAEHSLDLGPLSGLASRFGGLASIAGIDIGAPKVDRATISLETLRGHTFLVQFIKRRGLTVPLFAGRSYDPVKKEWDIDPDVYDVHTQRWVRWVLPPRTPEPSDFEIWKKFSKRVTVTENRRSGIINVTLEAKSPQISTLWASYLVEDLNDYLRRRDKLEAERTIEYLQEQVGRTQVAEMRTILFKLIEEQTKNLMLAEVRTEYALKVVDPPLKPDKPAWPQRSLLIFLSMLGGMAAAFASIIVPITWRTPANPR
jgi:hypothetical protein